MLAKLKFALKNHKKVVDKNVPLNRLGLNRQEWLNEAIFEETATDFEDEKSHFLFAARERNVIHSANKMA